MKNKILWLAIVGLALAKPPDAIDSTLSKFDGKEHKQRSSRSIWPFTSSATTTEAPKKYPPPSPKNNEWFVQGETSLPQGIDFNKYPIWKVHKYSGIDLHPVNIQPYNYDSPEETIVDVGYPSGSSLSPDFPPNSYLSGYQGFLTSGGHINQQSQSIHGTYSTGYPPATYPVENDRTGEYHSSSVIPGINQYNIQTQQKHEVYAPPQPLTDFSSTVISDVPKIPQYNYVLPNAYQQTGNGDYHQQEQIQPAGQRQAFSTRKEQSSVIQPESSDKKEPNLSLLDQLSVLNSFSSGDTVKNSESSSTNSQNNNAQQGFFENLVSRFRGTTEKPVPTSDNITNENEELPKSRGFLSSMFSLGSESTETPEAPSSFNLESESGNDFSSVFHQPEIEKPAVVPPTMYHLPKTKESYIAVQVPTKNPAAGYSPDLRPYNDLPNIASHDIPKVSFGQHGIPHISGSTLDSGYPYSPGYLDIRNPGLTGPTINTDYPPSVGFGQPHPATTGSESYSTKQQSVYQGYNYQVNQNFSPYSSTSNNAEGLNVPRAEYQHSLSANDAQANGSPVLSSSQSAYYREEQTAAQSDRQSPINNLNALTPTNVDEFTQSRNQNFNIQSLSGVDYQYQNFGTTNSNYQSQSNFDENVERDQEMIPIDNKGNEPIVAPQLSNDFIPVLSYGAPGKSKEQVNFDNGNESNNRQNINNDNLQDNFSEVFIQNFQNSKPTLNEDLVLPVQNQPGQSPLPIDQTSISPLQRLTTPLTQEEINRFLPTKEPIDFHPELNTNNEELTNNRFAESLSDSFAAASTNVKVITVYPSTSEKVDDSFDVNVNENALSSTLPVQQLPGRMKADRVVVRKVMKRRNLLEDNSSQRSNPARQAPAAESDASLIIRSENDSIPEIRGGHKFDETNIIVGYSKVQHPQREILQSDNDQAIKPVNPELRAV